jgi:hypothetical protein
VQTTAKVTTAGLNASATTAAWTVQALRAPPSALVSCVDKSAEQTIALNSVRCTVFGNLHSRMPLVPTPALLKLLQACDQWHFSESSRAFTSLTGLHCKLLPNTEGTGLSCGTVLFFWQGGFARVQ